MVFAMWLKSFWHGFSYNDDSDRMCFWSAGIELCLPGWRFSMTMVANFMMLAGQLLMPGLAALCRDWQILQAVIICPLILMLSYIWWVPLSWLFGHSYNHHLTLFIWIVFDFFEFTMKAHSKNCKYCSNWNESSKHISALLFPHFIKQHNHDHLCK